MAQEIIEVPITGKVISIEVKAGDTVQEGDVICYIESMKMENPILAPLAGTVGGIEISVGDVVETGKTITILEY